jgi:hypothetical protein
MVQEDEKTSPLKLYLERKNEMNLFHYEKGKESISKFSKTQNFLFG